MDPISRRLLDLRIRQGFLRPVDFSPLWWEPPFSNSLTHNDQVRRAAIDQQAEPILAHFTRLQRINELRRQILAMTADFGSFEDCRERMPASDFLALIALGIELNSL